MAAVLGGAIKKSLMGHRASPSTLLSLCLCHNPTRQLVPMFDRKGTRVLREVQPLAQGHTAGGWQSQGPKAKACIFRVRTLFILMYNGDIYHKVVRVHKIQPFKG